MMAKARAVGPVGAWTGEGAE
eukprot:SAG11_NODE_22648_length_402_cov_1.514851_1_plen_20_part_10